MRRHLLYDEFMAGQLRDGEIARQYLAVALEEFETDGDFAAFLLALRRVVESQGGTEHVAAKAHLDSETVATTLCADSKPSFENIDAILHALGFGLSLKPRARVS